MRQGGQFREIFAAQFLARETLLVISISRLCSGETGRFAAVTLVPSVRFRHPSTAPATRLYGTSSSLKNFVKAISLQKYATTKKTATRPTQCARFNASLGELYAMEEPRPENQGAEARSDAATSGTPAGGETAAEIMDSTPLFVYGTLMNEQVLSALLGRVPATKEACLSGYHRYRIKDKVYPAIRPKKEGNVRGLYMSGLCPREKLIFDLFEDEDYHKVDVKVEVDGFEAPQTATCYVWNASLECLLYSTWEPKEHFSDDGAVPDYVRHVKRFAQEIEEEGLLENID